MDLVLFCCEFKDVVIYIVFFEFYIVVYGFLVVSEKVYFY